MASRRKKTDASTDSGHIEQPPRVIAGWTVQRIELAKRMANSGDLSLAADLWEMVLGDERALGPLQALAGIAGVPITFETSLPGIDFADDPLVAALGRDFWSIFPEELQGEIIRWAIGLGVVPVHAAAWEADSETGRLLPRYDVWHPRALRFDGEKSVWKIRTRSNSDGVEFTPGDSEWLLFTPYGAKRPWTKAPWYGLGLLWYAAQCAKLGWFDWNDSHAAPTRVASKTTKVGEGESLLDDASRQELTEKVASLVRGGHITLPEGYDLKLLESASKNWESFVKLCDEVWPKAVAVAITGNNLTTQIEGGSFAASKSAENVSYDRKRTIARCLETTERRECLTWWAEFNFASTAPPWPKYQIEPQRDLTAAASRFQSSANGLATLRNAGYEIEDGEEDKLEELLGIRVRRAAAPPPPPGSAPRPPAARAQELATVASATVDGLALGQEFTDALVSEGVTAASAALAPDLRAIKRIIDEEQDPRRIRERLIAAYGEMAPAPFMAILERAEVLAAMAGRWSAAAEV
jgi:hypothetical protein